ncbi:TPA: DUF4443 domain-containing protein [Candidatus Geothermarchaeota archaeon]|nr:DUF4443 domain-containing protein [Candidatus Geothermarchaeota archaeon]HIQ13330.1 DUF4443 domain-containing protein [Thermoprotei archaeon]
MYNVWWRGKKQGFNSKSLLKDRDWLDFIKRFEEVRGRAYLRKSHVYIFLKTTYEENKFISRYNLKDILNLSEASTRTFLKKMVKLDIASTIKGGHHLTLYGKKLAEYIINKIREFRVTNEKPLPYRYSWGAAINHPFELGKLIDLRDDVIRNGGEAALILVIEDNEIIFPESKEKLSTYNNELSDRLMKEIGGFNCQFIIISFSNNLYSSRLSVLDAALNYIERV